MEREIGQFLGYIGAERGLTAKTIAAYRHDLGKFRDFANRELGGVWQAADVDPHLVKGFLRYLADKGNAAVSRGRKLATLKSFFKYLAAEGQVKTDPTAQMRMPKIQQKEPSYLTEREYKRLLKAVRNNATRYFKPRDTAIVTMFLGMGLRLSELVQLNVGDVGFEDGTVKVIRKGNQERILPANDEVLVTLRRYLRTRGSVAAQDPLFLSKRDRRIDTASVWYLVRKYLRQAQIEKERLSPHTLRHTFATTLLRQGENILTIKELLSHRNLRTTERYLHINGEDLKTAVGRIDLAF